MPARNQILAAASRCAPVPPGLSHPANSSVACPLSQSLSPLSLPSFPLSCVLFSVPCALRVSHTPFVCPCNCLQAQAFSNNQPVLDLMSDPVSWTHPVHHACYTRTHHSHTRALSCAGVHAGRHCLPEAEPRDPVRRRLRVAGLSIRPSTHIYRHIDIYLNMTLSL